MSMDEQRRAAFNRFCQEQEHREMVRERYKAPPWTIPEFPVGFPTPEGKPPLLPQGPSEED